MPDERSGRTTPVAPAGPAGPAGIEPAEPRVPEALARTQAAFAHAIAQPFDFDDGESGDYELRIDAYDLDLLRDIRPRPPASSAERLGIYNQQYWFRLLSVMQKEYPLTEHLLGTLAFNRMVMAYLVRWPSSHYRLERLSDRLARFLAEDPCWDRPMIAESVALEHAFIRAFDAREEPAFDAATLDDEERAALMDMPLGLQPHLHLFEEHWNLVACRRALADSRAALTPEPAHGFWAIHRDRATGRCDARALGPLQYHLLHLIRDGVALGDALDALVDVLDQEALAILAQNVEPWFAYWVELGWFTRQ